MHESGSLCVTGQLPQLPYCSRGHDISISRYLRSSQMRSSV